MGVKTLPTGVPRSVLVVMECPSFVVVKCLSKVTPVGVKTLPAGVPDRFLVWGHGVFMQSMCFAVVYCIMKVILVGVKTLPAGVPRSVLVVMECHSFVVVKCLSKVTVI